MDPFISIFTFGNNYLLKIHYNLLPTLTVIALFSVMIYVSMSSEIFVECPLVVDLQKLKSSEKKLKEWKKTQDILVKNSRKIQKTQLPATQVVAICLKIAEKKAWFKEFLALKWVIACCFLRNYHSLQYIRA